VTTKRRKNAELSGPGRAENREAELRRHIKKTLNDVKGGQEKYQPDRGRIGDVAPEIKGGEEDRSTDCCGSKPRGSNRVR